MLMRLPKRPSHLDSWTEAMATRAQEMRVAGISSSKIAAELGVSRNAVIGKLHRMGVAKPGKSQKPPSEKRSHEKKVPSAVETKPCVKPAWFVMVVEAPPVAVDPGPVEVPADPNAPLPESRPCTIMELTSKTCRFPFGDPLLTDFRFCGAEKEPDVAYCPSHAKRTVAQWSR